jgi:hypothetical protein
MELEASGQPVCAAPCMEMRHVSDLCVADHACDLRYARLRGFIGVAVVRR